MMQKSGLVGHPEIHGGPVSRTVNNRCDLIRLERTNMITKMEDRLKIDLHAMSEHILDHLRFCDLSSPSNPEMLNRVLVQFNRGALLQYQYGEIERAETICRTAVELFARLSARSTIRYLCLGNMIPPYINLARIYGQRGRIRESLNIFDDISDFGLRQRDLDIFDHRLSVDDAASIMDAFPSLCKLTLSCQIIEAARVLQLSDEHSALLALTEAAQVRPEYSEAFFQQYIHEVRSRALLGLGQYEAAMTALTEGYSQMSANSPDRITVLTLISQIYREWGQNDLAEQTLNKLEEYLLGLETLGRRSPLLRQLAYRLALERHAMGDDARAVEPAEKAFKLCSEWKDQPGSIKSCILLMRISSRMRYDDPECGAKGRHCYDELQKLASTSYFRTECACAYWELGITPEFAPYEHQTLSDYSDECLRHSYFLYQSIPLSETMKSAESVKRLLELRGITSSTPNMRVGETVHLHSSSIDSVYEALMQLGQ